VSDFLLELRSEEIPARMQAGARAELERLFRREMDAAGVDVGDVTVWSTPRRLVLIAKGLPDATEAVSEEAKGPPEGAPDTALEGFCRKNGVTKDQLQLRDVKGRQTWFAVIDKPGRSTKDVLADAVPTIVRDFAWPKSMRWGAASLSTESIRWVRPLSGIVALFGDDVVDCDIHGVTSGAVTLGHRFHHSGDITIGNADDYAVKLRAGHVIVDHEERASLIREGAAKVAAEAGLTLVEDEGLVVENAGLTEWPVPLLGRFDEAFLDVPPEVIQLTARVNQKYFVCEDSGGKLANAFVCTANIEAEDGGAAIIEGNRKVLAARLSDARFFWEQDRKTSLADHAKKLERITFHEKLGTVADKVERVAKLARWLVDSGVVTGVSSELAYRAGELCKADLVTEMVGEFPELQGIMGAYYAAAEKLPPSVVEAIRDHYKPLGPTDSVPKSPATVAVALADKLDTLTAFFAMRQRPTGSRDPFALRRASLGAIRLITENQLRLELKAAFEFASDVLSDNLNENWSSWDSADIYDLEDADPNFRIENAVLFYADRRIAPVEEVTKQRDLMLQVMTGLFESPLALDDFFADRLKVQQREAGVRHDLIDAVFALGGEDDLVRLLARVHALQSFVGTEDGANLLAGYKRAANILKKEDWQGAEGHIAQTGEEDPLALVDDPDLAPVIKAKLEQAKNKSLSYIPELAEQALTAALDSAEPKASAAVEAEDFSEAMRVLASLRAPIDAFFTEVTVNDPDPDKRAARLDLLVRFRDAVHRVADFSKIEG
jgi:glycyl-tRNA synthetase beta chain